MERKELQIIDERELLGKHFVIYGTKEDPLFKAKDVAEWIGHSNVSTMIKDIDEDEKVLDNIYTLGGMQECLMLTEDGLYEVLMQSKKPIAKQFKKEVKKILKQIRQTGGYIPIVPEETNEQLMARAFIVAQNTIAERDRQLAAKEAEIKELTPKAEYCDAVLTSYSGVTTTVIAQDYGMSAQKFNKLLMKMHIQYKQGNTWVLYREHKGKGYTESETIVKNGYSVVSTRWTQKGRQFIYETLKDAGILPVKEINEVKENNEAD